MASLTSLLLEGYRWDSTRTTVFGLADVLIILADGLQRLHASSYRQLGWILQERKKKELVNDHTKVSLSNFTRAVEFNSIIVFRTS